MSNSVFSQPRMDQETGEFIRSTRIKQNKTIREVASQAGLSIGLLSALEVGHKQIYFDSLYELGQVLKEIAILLHEEESFKKFFIRHNWYS